MHDVCLVTDIATCILICIAIVLIKIVKLLRTVSTQNALKWIKLKNSKRNGGTVLDLTPIILARPPEIIIMPGGRQYLSPHRAANGHATPLTTQENCTKISRTWA